MKKIDFNEFSSEELIEKYLGFKSDLFGLKFQLSVGQLPDANKIEIAKRNIARALTEMNKRGIDTSKIKMPAVKRTQKVKGSKQKVKKADVKTAEKKQTKAIKEPKEAKAEPKKTAAKAKKEGK